MSQMYPARAKPLAPPLVRTEKPKSAEPDLTLWQIAKEHGSRVRFHRSFGLYTVLVECEEGPTLIFKNACAWARIETPPRAA